MGAILTLTDPRLDQVALDKAAEWIGQNPRTSSGLAQSAAYWIAKEAHEMCQCLDTVLVKLVLKNGTTQYKRRCLWCGKGGNSLSHKSLTDEAKANAPEYDEAIHGYQAAKYTTAALREIVFQRIVESCDLSDYNEYIASQYWHDEVRHRIYTLDEGKCQKCGASIGLHCHHLHYSNLRNEPDGDLVMLCYDCHAEFHEQKRYAEVVAQSYVIVKTAHNYRNAKRKDQHYESLKGELQRLNLNPDDYERRIFELAKAMGI